VENEGTDMPKQKTRKGVVKRFKTTGTGKIRRRRACARHLMTDKSAKRKRHLRHGLEVSAADRKRVREMLEGK
jgi:large subunit ribosomal protein L35